MAPRFSIQSVFSLYTNGEIQAGPSIQAPIRINLPGKGHPYEIRIGSKQIKGTRIPASTLAKFRSGEWKPGPRTMQKLRNFQNRINYNRLRASGASVKEARKHFRSKDVPAIIDKYRSIVQTITAAKNQQRESQNLPPIEPAYILWGISRSIRQFDDWDSYTGEHDYTDVENEFDEDDDWEEWSAGDTGDVIDISDFHE